MPTRYCLKKGRGIFYQPETFVASLLLLIVLSFKVIFNYKEKHNSRLIYFIFIQEHALNEHFKINWFIKQIFQKLKN